MNKMDIIDIGYVIEGTATIKENVSFPVYLKLSGYFDNTITWVHDIKHAKIFKSIDQAKNFQDETFDDSIGFDGTKLILSPFRIKAIRMLVEDIEDYKPKYE